MLSSMQDSNANEIYTIAHGYVVLVIVRYAVYIAQVLYNKILTATNTVSRGI